jgi:hypothetical protein
MEDNPFVFLLHVIIPKTEEAVSGAVLVDTG